MGRAIDLQVKEWICIRALGFLVAQMVLSTCNSGYPGLIPGSGRSPGEGNGSPHQYSCLENSMDRRDWWATVHRVAKSQTPNIFTFTYLFQALSSWESHLTALNLSFHI